MKVSVERFRLYIKKKCISRKYKEKKKYVKETIKSIEVRKLNDKKILVLKKPYSLNQNRDFLPFRKK